MQQRLDTEREVFVNQLAETKTTIATQYEERTRQLETVVTEKDRLCENANEMINNLQKENERVAAAGANERRELQESYASEKQRYQQEIKHLQTQHSRLTEQYENLEQIIATNKDLQRLKEFE